MQVTRAALGANGADESEAWLAFAREQPVAADWAAQDLGERAADLLVEARSAKALAKLADAAGSASV